MRKKLVHLAVGLVLCPGCSLVTTATRNMSYEVCLKVTNAADCTRLRAMANAAWEEFRARDGRPYSPDFEAGFKDGYWDFLYNGGNGEPPALPPKQYWKSRYETPQGYRAIQDWFAGFRQGAARAHDSGYRQFVTVPTSLSPGGPPAPLPVDPPAAPPAAPHAPVLPMPTKTDVGPTVTVPIQRFSPVTTASAVSAPPQPTSERAPFVLPPLQTKSLEPLSPAPMPIKVDATPRPIAKEITKSLQAPSAVASSVPPVLSTRSLETNVEQKSGSRPSAGLASLTRDDGAKSTASWSAKPELSVLAPPPMIGAHKEDEPPTKVAQESIPIEFKSSTESAKTTHSAAPRKISCIRIRPDHPGQEPVFQEVVTAPTVPNASPK